MAEGVRIGGGYVDVSADMTNFDNAMEALPKKASSKMEAAMKSLQAQMTKSKLDLKIAVNQAAITGNTAPVVAITALQERLKDKMDAVTAAATRQAQAIQESTRASLAASKVPTGITDAEAAGLSKVGAAGIAAGQQVRKGAMNGAMGLMVLSQTLDDAQYGFKSVVNNLPMLGATFGPLLGMSTQAAMKFGAIAGIAGVAINYIINHWDQLFQRFGYGTETMKMVWQSFWGETKDITIDALDTISTRIKELEDKPIKMAVDLHELEVAKEALKELKAGRQAWEQMGKSQSGEEKDSGDVVKSVLGNIAAKDMAKIQNDLVTARADAMNANAPAQQRLNLTAEEEAKIRNAHRLASTNGGMYGESFGGELDIAAGNAAVEAERQRRRDELAKVKQVNKQKAADELGIMVDKAQRGDDVAKAALAKALRDAKHGNIAEAIEAPTSAANEQQGREHERAYQAKQRAEADALNAKSIRDEIEWRQAEAEKRSREADRFASALQPRLSGDILKSGGISDKDLDSKIKDALKQAGVAAEDIGKMVFEVRTKLRKEVKDRVDTKVAGGLTREHAELAVAQEDREKKRALGGKGPTIESTESYLNKILLASGGKPNDLNERIPAEQLAEQKNNTAVLIQIQRTLEKQQADRAARFGPNRR